MAKECIYREDLYKFLKNQSERIRGAYTRGRQDGLNIAKSALHNPEITPTADVVSREDHETVVAELLFFLEAWHNEAVGDSCDDTQYEELYAKYEAVMARYSSAPLAG